MAKQIKKETTDKSVRFNIQLNEEQKLAKIDILENKYLKAMKNFIWIKKI